MPALAFARWNQLRMIDAYPAALAAYRSRFQNTSSSGSVSLSEQNTAVTLMTTPTATATVPDLSRQDFLALGLGLLNDVLVGTDTQTQNETE